MNTLDDFLHPWNKEYLRWQRQVVQNYLSTIYNSQTYNIICDNDKPKEKQSPNFVKRRFDNPELKPKWR